MDEYSQDGIDAWELQLMYQIARHQEVREMT